MEAESNVTNMSLLYLTPRALRSERSSSLFGPLLVAVYFTKQVLFICGKKNKHGKFSKKDLDKKCFLDTKPAILWTL